MFAFRINAAHVDALRELFAPRKPRNPLLRLAFGLVGFALLLVLVVVGVFVGAAMLFGGALLRLLRARTVARTPASARVVEGEYRVVGKPGTRKPQGPALPLGR